MPFTQYAQAILELDGLLEPLRHLAESCGVPSPEREHWYALLKHKLVPQLTGKPFLLVAVMGGTNTGKSLIFNHLAGESFSAVDHRASGTKHPVCLVPKSDGVTSYESILARHFDTFQCVPWSNAEQPLELSDENYLYWIEGKNVPERLLLLDTPDFDADREVNWDRATAIRHAADVLIAVLTEQKYNDASVRRFFREAAEADKPIMVLFNMVDLDGDKQHLAQWLEQFCRETGTKPMEVLVAPYNREGVEMLTLPFFAVRNDTFVPIDLKTELCELHFDTIKTQTLLGAIKILDDPLTGVQSYLYSIHRASSKFAEALKTLENIGEAEVQWSGLPATILADEVRTWWNAHRPAWSQKVNSVYRKVGGGLLWSVRKTVDYFKGTNDAEQIKSLEDFRAAERRTAIEFVSKIMDKLAMLPGAGRASMKNPILQREISELTSGEHRALLLQRAYSVLDSLPPVDQEFRELLHRRLSDWATENPKMAAWMLMVDNIMTAAHPLVTVALAVSGGWVVAGGTTAAAVVASGATAAAVGETAIQAGTEGIAGRAAKLFQQIQEDYVLTRSQAFAEGFQKELWQDIMARLQSGASATQSDIFKRCRNWRTA
ncbi:MAG: GTPase domain-containing protein [Planctomycetaceae bacterium]|nr:GTPase domain-containing protein [Planctomycetaceae bacterium]